MNKYELLQEKYINELGTTGKMLIHKKTGARVLLFPNDDDNKVFMIGFRTPPTDDTGLPHILELSTLCGSKKFPSKEPFVELLKGSLNTFLNAMTYPDKTVYPVASCNLKDFHNLTEVYMDAVFYPNVHNKEEIFKQEGWHYELEDKDQEIKYNGVVYNEMKGAFSSPEQIVMRESMHALFPDTSYGVESGGNPDFIPDLSYEEFKAFHKKYYHPSNSYIVLYGNCDMDERLEWLDNEYLSKFDKIEIESKIKYQDTFSKPVYEVINYPIGKDEDDANKTYYAYNAVIGDCKDSKLAFAFTILTYILLDAPGAPLKQALLDSKLSKDVFGSYESGILQPMFSIISKDSIANSIDLFENTIKETLNNICKEGIDKKSIKAAINFFEFKYHEADFGYMPKGLVCALNAMDTWLYDDNDPFTRLEYNDVFEFLHNNIEGRYFEELIEKYLLNNNHVAYVTLSPDKNLAEKNEALLKEKLANYKNSLTDEEIEALILDTKNLKAYQEAPSTKEEIDSIPLLTRDDINDYVEPLYNEFDDINGVKLVSHDLFTNGIGYLTLSFNVSNIPSKYIPYLGLLSSVLGFVDTKNYTYQDLFKEITMNTGGVGCRNNTITFGNDEMYVAFEFKASALYGKMDFVFDIINEIIYTSKFDNKKRMYEIIAQNKSRRQMSLVSAGHIASINRALSYISKGAYFDELVSGINQYQFIEDLEANFDNKFDEVVNVLNELMHYVFRKENLIISYTANKEAIDNIKPLISDFTNNLYTDPIKTETFFFEPNIKNEGFKTSSQVQFVARVGKFSKEKYSGAATVFKMALGYDYLWLKVRVLGGAYGCMSRISKNGVLVLVSYRDPNLSNTMNVYEDIPAYIDSFNPTDDEITKYIIGAIGEMAAPLNAKAKGDRSFNAYITNTTLEELKKERKEVLNVNIDDIKALKEIFVEALNNNALCVIGNEAKIEEDKALFKEIKNLFK